MPGINLTSTRYLLNTDDLLAGWDEKSWIEVADDRQAPDSSVSSFAELAAAAASGGPASDAQKVHDHIINVLSRDARSSEEIVESFCLGIYILPLTPCDGVAKTLMLDWMRHTAKVRHDLYRNPDAVIQVEAALNSRGRMIRSEMTRLSATRGDLGSNANEAIAAFGGDLRRDSTSYGPFTLT